MVIILHSSEVVSIDAIHLEPHGVTTILVSVANLSRRSRSEIFLRAALGLLLAFLCLHDFALDRT